MTKVVVTETVTTEVIFDSEDFLDSFSELIEGSVEDKIKDAIELYGLDYLSDFDWARTHFDSEGLTVDID